MSVLNQSFQAVVDSNGGGIYTSIAEAFSDGNISVFVRNGTYIEANEIKLPSGGQLIGESFGSVIIVGKISIDGSNGIKETAGTVSISNVTNQVVGVGTTFTNLNAGNHILISNNFIPILSIEDDTHLTLARTYFGKTVSNDTYLAQNIYIGCQVSNLILTNSSSIGLYIRATKHTVINKVTSMQSNSHNFMIEDSADSIFNTIVGSDSVTGSGICCKNSTDILFQVCNIFNNNLAGISLDTGCNFVVFNSCSSSSNNGEGIYLKNSSSEIVVKDCLFKRNNSHGMNIETNITYLLISNCICHDNNGDGIYNLSTYCNINGNISRLNNGNGITVDNESNIIGNTCYSNSSDGINILGDDSNLSGNITSLNLNDGLKIKGNNNSINGNVLKNNTNNGINLEATSNKNNTVGNQIKLNTVSNIIDNGTDNIEINNILTT
jgi:hypothetical protein